MQVFIREVIFNVLDVLVKLQYQFMIGKDVVESEFFFEINIVIDQEKGILIIKDYGIGMIRDELLGNLGIIVRLGLKVFFDEFGK